MQPDRAPHFRIPYLESAPDGAGFHLTSTGGLAMVEGDAAVRQSLLILLSTTPGERVMRPDYGCDLQKLIFSPNDDTTAGLAIHFIRRAITRWERRAEILNLDARRSDVNASSLEISLTYRVRTTHSTGRLDMALDLGGSADLRTGH